jgi:hypothetical protein
MNRTVRIALAFALGVGIATGVAAQGRHDEKPHGYDAKVAAERVPPPATPEKYVILPSGPRGHDNPLRGRKITLPPKPAESPAAGQGSQKK